MATAYIVDAVRTAGGRRDGRLAGWHPVNLAAAMLDAIVDRTGIDPVALEDVIMGCVTQAGEQSGQIGRYAVLASSLPFSVPAVTIDRQCGSSQQAIQFAAQAVMSGTMDVIIAAGVESMTRTPMRLARIPGSDFEPMTEQVRARIGVSSFSQFAGAEMIAKKWGFTRGMLDAYGLESHIRAQAATKAGAFANEIVPIPIELPDGTSGIHDQDEGIRWDASEEGMAKVKVLMEGGVITAATSSQVTDGASAVLIVSEAALKTHNLTPIARIVDMTVTAGDPVVMLEEPLFATDKALKKSGMTIEDIDLYEVNEAFAPVPMAWMQYHNVDHGRLNVNGGAISLGHPLGASGTKLMATLINALKARGKRHGLLTMCEGGGIANVTIVEAL